AWPALSCRQLVEESLCLLQIERIETFGEPAVDRSEKLASLIPLALIAPQPGHAHSGTEFPGFRLLCTRDRKLAVEIRFGFRRVGLRRQQRDFPSDTIDLRFT